MAKAGGPYPRPDDREPRGLNPPLPEGSSVPAGSCTVAGKDVPGWLHRSHRVSSLFLFVHVLDTALVRVSRDYDRS